MKIELLDESMIAINRPETHYSYIYAPRATEIHTASADIIFCGFGTKILMPCADIRRGEWYYRKGYIRCRIDSKFRWKVKFHKCN
ncbi:MAG: hypothetical protein FWG80_03930 [Alphaproteobacteria bacterium]|nr:hypothetical protein [Alphaproteobacteria bacterium]